MRILAVTSAAPPHAFGGADVYAHDLARALAREHDVHVFARAPLGPGEKVVTPADAGLPYTAFASGYAGGDRVARIEAAFSALLDRHEPEIVHVHQLAHLSWNLPRLAAAHGATVVLTLHDHWTICQRTFLVDARWQPCGGPSPSRCWSCLSRVPDFTPRSGMFARATGLDARGLLASIPPRQRSRQRHIREMLQHVALMISPSHHLKANIVRHLGLREDDVVVCPFGITPVGATSPRDQERSDVTPPQPADSASSRDRRLRVGYVGAVSFHKGVHVLLDAFAAGVDADLVVFGRVALDFDAARGAELRARASVHGSVDAAARAAMYEAMDVLVLPSVCHENFPLVIREAFTAGVPVVASDLAGMAEGVRHGVDGLLFRPGDAADLRRTLQMLVDDRSLLSRLRAGAPPVKTLDAHATEMVTLFERVRRGHGTTPHTPVMIAP